MRTKGRRGLTLIELLVTAIVMVVAGAGLAAFVRTTYDAQDTILGQGTADMLARQAVDIIVDNLRDAQWFDPQATGCTSGCGGTAIAQAISSAGISSVTYHTDTRDGSQVTALWLTNDHCLVKQVNGGAQNVILTGVQSLTFSYYEPNDWWNAVAPTPADYPKIGAMGVSVTIAETGMRPYTSSESSYVRLRNSPPNTGSGT